VVTPASHADWLVGFIGAGAAPDEGEVEARFGPPFTEWLGIDGITGMLARMAAGLRVTADAHLEEASFRVLAGLKWGGPPHWRIDGEVDRETGRISVLGFNVLEIEGVDVIDVTPTAELSPAQQAALHALFAANYAHADHDYLDGSLARIGFVSAAWAGERAVAFGLSETRVVDLPGLPGQVLGLAGLSCVDAAFRRQGLAFRLEVAGMAAGDAPATSNRMGAGRMAHAASWSRFVRLRGSVPQPGSVITDWHEEVGAACAALLGVTDFDADTFVCRGSGRPIGDPLIDLDDDVDDGLRGLFGPVDRSRGDSLLGIWWAAGNPPQGWEPPNLRQ
jgi:hypothetical protein